MRPELLQPEEIGRAVSVKYEQLGFAEPSASWGVMLQDAGRIAAITEAPWMLAPAGAIVAAVLATHLLVANGAESEPAIR